jgi:hypothetical protein
MLTELRDDDCGGITLRDLEGEVVVTFGVARDAAIAPSRQPSVAFRDQVGAPGELIGTGPVELDRWYQFDATYDSENLRFRCSIVDETDGSVFGALDVPVTARADVAFLAFMIDDFTGDGAGTSLFTNCQVIVGTENGAMNPAHIVYDSLVTECMQGEPVALVSDASFRAAADKLFAEGFGLCPEWDPDQETVEAFRQRICNVIGAQCSRSTVDGLWYLDLVRGDYVVEDLPVLTDDDILEFQCDLSTLEDSVNQVSVRWFDPFTKQERTTAPVHALGAIHASGGIVPEIVSYPEIPIESLANRCAARDLQARATPTKRFTLTTNRVPYAWRRGSYFRLQTPKRGIADMVCLVGEISKGTLRSGAIKLIAIQDVYSMPTTTYLVGQPPASGGTTAPTAIQDEVLFEAPYVELVGELPATELAALDADAGFVQAVGVRPVAGLNYQLRTRPAGGEFDIAGTFDWCPSATIDAAADDVLVTEFILAGGTDLGAVPIGSAAKWGNEFVRVDALDLETGDVTFGRGCADTVPQPHAAGERVYFYDAWSSSDRTEYVTGETVEAKLLTRTGTALLDEADADLLSVILDQRAARPYPPGKLRITDALVSDAAYPANVVGEVTLTWAHRDRVLQADQLIDEGAASVGPEAGTTYTVRYYLDDVLDNTESGIAGTSSTPYTLSGNGAGRIEVEALRDGLTSWQAATAEFDYLVEPLDVRITVGGDRRVSVGGHVRVTKG